MISLLGFVLAVLAAIAWYTGSPHCMWSALRGYPRPARIAGSVLMLLSLACWIGAAGIAVGLCATLASGMLGLMAQPWLAMFFGTPSADVTAVEKE
jgi:hypothetical protein